MSTFKQSLLRGALLSAVGLGGGLLPSTAQADEPAPASARPRVRTQVTVEVIDDARHVDDIIARVNAQRREGGEAPPPKPLEARKLDRAPLPAAREHEERTRDKGPRRERRTERERSLVPRSRH